MVCAVLQAYEQMFPGRIMAGDGEGSDTDQSHVESSNI